MVRRAVGSRRWSWSAAADLERLLEHTWDLDDEDRPLREGGFVEAAWRELTGEGPPRFAPPASERRD